LAVSDRRGLDKSGTYCFGLRHALGHQRPQTDLRRVVELDVDEALGHLSTIPPGVESMVPAQRTTEPSRSRSSREDLTVRAEPVKTHPS
jgi:hypothetical protein